MIELIKEFDNMKKMKLFEIEIDEEFYIYYISATQKGLEAGGCSNTGFMPYGLIVDFEEDSTLDIHLEALYELCYEDAFENKE